MTDRLTFTIPETARLLGISRGAAYTAAANHTIPTITVGRRKLVPRAALAKLLGIDHAAERMEPGKRFFADGNST
jgi:excisionase family DNA binding protein